MRKSDSLKKLVLSKETLRVLSGNEMERVQGGNDNPPTVIKAPPDLTCNGVCTGEYTASCQAKCGGCTDYC